MVGLVDGHARVVDVGKPAPQEEASKLLPKLAQVRGKMVDGTAHIFHEPPFRAEVLNDFISGHHQAEVGLEILASSLRRWPRSVEPKAEFHARRARPNHELVHVRFEAVLLKLPLNQSDGGRGVADVAHQHMRRKLKQLGIVVNGNDRPSWAVKKPAGGTAQASE